MLQICTDNIVTVLKYYQFMELDARMFFKKKKTVVFDSSSNTIRFIFPPDCANFVVLGSLSLFENLFDLIKCLIFKEIKV